MNIREQLTEYFGLEEPTDTEILDALQTVATNDRFTYLALVCGENSVLEQRELRVQS